MGKFFSIQVSLFSTVSPCLSRPGDDLTDVVVRLKGQNEEANSFECAVLLFVPGVSDNR